MLKKMLFSVASILILTNTLNAAVKKPIIDIITPDNNSVTFQKDIVVKGKVINTSGLKINDRRVSFDQNGNFVHKIKFSWFGLQYIKMVATDDTNQKAIKYLKITYRKPQEKPKIFIVSPAKGTTTGKNEIYIKGYVENITSLYINKKLVKLNKRDNRDIFEQPVKLLFEGANKITLYGLSYDNKEVNEEIFVTKVASYTPGKDINIDIFFPVNNFETTKSKVAVKGRAKNISRLYINDEKVKINKDGIFYTEKPLQFGSNKINIIGVDKNEVPVKVTRTVVRLNKDLKDSKRQQMDIEMKKSDKKNISVESVFIEKNRLEEIINNNTQKSLSNIIGSNKVIFSALIHLNNQKIREDNNKEFDGNIETYIKKIDLNIVLDKSLRGKKESKVKQIVNSNMRILPRAPKNYVINYESFSKSNSFSQRSSTFEQLESIYSQLNIKKNNEQEKIQEFLQDYLNNLYGKNIASVYSEIILDKNKIKQAFRMKKYEVLFDSLDTYSKLIQLKVMLNKKYSEKEIKIKSVLEKNINQYGNYLIDIKFIYDDFSPVKKAESFSPLMSIITSITILLIGMLFLALFTIIRDKQQEKRYESLLEKIQRVTLKTNNPAIKVSGEGRSSTNVNVSSLDKNIKFFNFVNEENLHKLKLALSVKIGQDQASVDTIATIISYLDSDMASKVLTLYPPKIQAQVFDLLSEPQMHNIETIEKIEKDIKDMMSGTVGGKSVILGIMDNMSYKRTKYIFNELEEKYPQAYRIIKPEVYIFEDILTLDDEELEILFKEVEPRLIAIAISTLKEKEKTRILDLLSENVRSLVSEWLELKARKFKDIDAEKAQKVILNIAKSLDENNEIKIRKG